MPQGMEKDAEMAHNVPENEKEWERSGATHQWDKTSLAELEKEVGKNMDKLTEVLQKLMETQQSQAEVQKAQIEAIKQQSEAILQLKDTVEKMGAKYPNTPAPAKATDQMEYKSEGGQGVQKTEGEQEVQKTEETAPESVAALVAKTEEKESKLAQALTAIQEQQAVIAKSLVAVAGGGRISTEVPATDAKPEEEVKKLWGQLKGDSGFKAKVKLIGQAMDEAGVFSDLDRKL